MKRYIKASFSPSMPDWLKKSISGRYNTKANRLVNQYHISLDKANFSSYEPESGKFLPIYLLELDNYNIVYIPGVNDDETCTINGRYRKLGSIAKSKLKDMAIDTVWIDLADSNNVHTRYKERYRDPRYTYRYNDRGDYAGQYRTHGDYLGNGEYEVGPWSDKGRTPANESRARDKSGYKVRRPEEMIAEYYEKYPNKITNKLDDVYDRIIEVREKLNSYDFNVPRSSTSWTSNIRNMYSYLGYAIEEYSNILANIDESSKFKRRYGYGNQFNQFARDIASIHDNLDRAEKELNELRTQRDLDYDYD